MSERDTFGRRGTDQERQSRIFRTEADQPVAAPAKPKPTTRELVIGFFGLALGIGVLMHSGKSDDPVSPAKPATVQVAAKTAQPAPDCTATLAEYLALGTGTSLGQATSIIGCKGIELSRVSLGGTEDVTMQWQGNGGIISNMVASFDTDRLISKAQLALE